MATDEYCMRILYYTTPTVRNTWREGGRASSTRFIFSFSSSSPPKQPRYRSDIFLFCYIVHRSAIRRRKGRGQEGCVIVSFWTPSLLGARVVHDELRGEIMGYDVNLRSLKFMQMTTASRVCLRDHDSFYFLRVNDLFHVA